MDLAGHRLGVTGAGNSQSQKHESAGGREGCMHEEESPLLLRW